MQFDDPYSLQLLQDHITKDEILHKQRQEASRAAQFAKLERNPWKEFQDRVGDANTCPTFIREAFWSGKDFSNRQRMIVVNFC